MNENPLLRLYDGLALGDIGAVRACFIPQAVIWHGFDGILMDLETFLRSIEGLIGYTTERRIQNVKTLTTAEGLVQQHVFVSRTQAGDRKAWHVCLVAQIADGLITRIDEYIDRAGFFVPDNEG